MAKSFQNTLLKLRSFLHRPVQQSHVCHSLWYPIATKYLTPKPPAMTLIFGLTIWGRAAFDSTINLNCSSLCPSLSPPPPIHLNAGLPL